MGTIVLADVTEIETIKISELTKVTDIDSDDVLPVVRDNITRKIEPLDLATAGYWRSYEPFLDENSANVIGKPTLVTRGVFKGYSLPVDGGTESLFFRVRVPFRWDGVTNPWFVAIASISAAEDIGDKYKFQFEWASQDIGGLIPDAVQETLTDEVTVVDGTEFYAQIIQFEMDATTIVSGQNMQAQLVRIAASEPQVSNEIIVWHWCTRWRCNKWGTSSVMGY